MLLISLFFIFCSEYLTKIYYTLHVNSTKVNAYIAPQHAVSSESLKEKLQVNRIKFKSCLHSLINFH